MKVAIIYNRLFEFDGSKLSIGGIQTYLQKLAEVVNGLGWEPAIFQLATQEFEQRAGLTQVFGKTGMPVESAANDIGTFLSDCAAKWIGTSPGLIIFGSDSYFVNSPIPSIAIQHGVAWDLPNVETITSAKTIVQKLKAKFRESRLNHLRRAWMDSGNKLNRTMEKIRFLVCVDYNFYNVSKARGKVITSRVWVIPNFADLVPVEEIASQRQRKEVVRILFARRFCWYRGTRLISPVFRRILAEFPEVHITLAGDGPDESWLREYFADSDRISFIKYDHQELTAILLNHDIAVVASLGSEGTSLSAIEAMGAGCAVLATCVGGLTNIIIDGYNGKLVLPVEEDLYLALRMLVENETLRERLAAKAYETVQDSFNIVLWKDKWSQVLRNVAAQ